MKRFLLALALSLCSGGAFGGQFVVSQVTTDPNVASGEAWVVTDPIASQEVTVVWLGTTPALQAQNAPNGYCGVAQSSDGGHTWRRKRLPFREATTGGTTGVVQVAGRTVPICGDPVAGVGPDGTLYAAAANVGSPQWTQGLTSDDHGWSWSEPSEVFGVNQFVNAAIANMAVPDAGMGRAYMAVDPVTGEISVHSQVDAATVGRMITTSTDHGATWSTPRPVGSTSAGPHSAANGVIAVGYVSGSSIVFQTSTDHGASWNRQVMPAGQSAGSPMVAADPTTPGRFAVLLSNGSPIREVWVTTNSGTDWTKTKVLTAASGDSLVKPAIAYSPTGALGVAWRTQHPDGSTEVAAIVSRDGGTSFDDVVPLTSGRIPPDPNVGPGDDCACNLHLDATTLSETWADSSTGQRQVYFGRFDYTTVN